jgi:putative flippase GtrA
MRHAGREPFDGRRAGESGVNALLARVGRGLVVSVATTLLTAAILVALAVGAGMPAGVANVVAVVCGIGPSYVGNRRFVWRREGRGSLVHEVVPFWTLSLTGLAASTLAVTRVASWSHGHSASLRAIALPVANLTVFGGLWIVQFLLCDRVIFRQRCACVVAAWAKDQPGEREAAPTLGRLWVPKTRPGMLSSIKRARQPSS